jgi:hypothetical protein
MAIKFCPPLLIALVFCVPVLSACAGTTEPQFEDYRVDNIFAGPNHALDVPDQSNDKWATYRSNAIKRKVNFAGHYIIYTGDCGGGAVCGEILDAKTGKIVSGFPNAYQLDSPDGSYYDAGFRPESRLLVISGVAADPEKNPNGKVLPAQNRTRYFEFKDNKLVLIKAD